MPMRRNIKQTRTRKPATLYPQSREMMISLIAHKRCACQTLICLIASALSALVGEQFLVHVRNRFLCTPGGHKLYRYTVRLYFTARQWRC